MIREVKFSDSEAIAEIYNYYIEKSPATFEEVPVAASDMEKRIQELKKDFPYLVCEENEEIVGYAYAHHYHPRSAYRFTLEDSIYIRNGFQGRGTGKALLGELLGKLKNNDVHAIVAAITIPNAKSIALHESFGFKKIGIFKEVGRKFNRWQDVGHWEYFYDVHEI
ncbi:MAG: GNAT family N-acetyltransferase [Prevotellaceae bacterium]|jgi:phosphinothricin acetyltransferase|nr:GNAT family N-acetyltransferase [Prevotellaceae bacterium]